MVKLLQYHSCAVFYLGGENNVKNTERISAMEERLNRSLSALRALEAALDAYEAVKPDIEALSLYYGSADWFADLEACEKGELPKELRCGVLSQDGIYNMLEANGELTAQIKKITEMADRSKGGEIN